MNKLKENKKIIWLTVVIITLVIVAVVVVFNVYKSRIEKKVSTYVNQYLSDVMDESAERISVKINENFKTLEALSMFIREYDDMQCEEIKSMLDKQIQGALVKRYNVITKDGKEILNNSHIKNLMEQDFVKEAFNGKNTISDINISSQTEEKEIIFSVPIYKGNQVAGILQFAYNLDAFAELIGDTVLNKKTETFIMQADGTLVSKPKTVSGDSNFYHLLGSAMINEPKAIERLKSNIKNGETGTLVIGEDKYKRYICYNQIPENNWYAITIMSAGVVEGDISDISIMSAEIGQSIIIIFVLLIIYIFAVYLRSSVNTRLNSQRYKLVAEHSNSIIFEYNYKKDTAFHNSKWKENLGYDPIESDYFKEMTGGNIIVPEDVEAFESVFEELRQGRELVEKEIRIFDKDKNPIWHKMKAGSIKKRSGKITKIIGRYINVDKSKREVEYFKEQAQHDLATGLYNKETTSYKISKVLSTLGQGMKSALLFVDIDDFKDINDTYGHSFGDELLVEFSNGIKEFLNETAFAGRVGGDEFVIMLSRIENEEEALQYAKEVSKKLSAISFSSHPEVRISVSIGIAIAPKHGRDMTTLIRCADEAMYKAKEQGKKCVVLG